MNVQFNVQYADNILPKTSLKEQNQSYVLESNILFATLKNVTFVP